ncbi:MAG: sulfatase-like hydrolase/transferase [Chloroflexi bacterium]|nr:sulfatase-like hydrolase/transferase [Chloroflexota bacterium]
MKKPNIILLTVDTLRADTLGYAGYHRPITPHIDRLAAQSVRFMQTITSGSWTQAAFPGIITSTCASMYGGCLGPLAKERPSPIKALATQKGYKTAAFSTSPLLSKTYGYDNNIEHFVDLDPGEKDPTIRDIKGGQRLLCTPFVHRITKLFGLNWRPPKVYSTAADLNDIVMRWFDDNSDVPFFAWLHYMDVHWPYHLEETLTEPDEIAMAWADLAHMYEINWNGVPVSAEQTARYVRLYEDAIAYCDAQIGKLMAYLDESGLAENSIVLFVSDHGEEFLERRHWGHVELNLYDEILKVPMIIRVPGIEEQEIDQQVSTLDIMPTILDLADCDVPEEMLGSSLVPLWSGRSDEYDVEIAIGERWRDTSHMIAVRSAEFKYIWDDAQPDKPELYDLRVDPEEKNNVAIQHPEIVAKMHAHVEAQLVRMKETTPTEVMTEPDLDKEIIARLRSLGYVE